MYHTHADAHTHAPTHADAYTHTPPIIMSCLSLIVSQTRSHHAFGLSALLHLSLIVPRSCRAAPQSVFYSVPCPFCNLAGGRRRLIAESWNPLCQLKRSIKYQVQNRRCSCTSVSLCHSLVPILFPQGSVLSSSLILVLNTKVCIKTYKTFLISLWIHYHSHLSQDIPFFSFRSFICLLLSSLSLLDGSLQSFLIWLRSVVLSFFANPSILSLW